MKNSNSIIADEVEAFFRLEPVRYSEGWKERVTTKAFKALNSVGKYSLFQIQQEMYDDLIKSCVKLFAKKYEKNAILEAEVEDVVAELILSWRKTHKGQLRTGALAEQYSLRKMTNLRMLSFLEKKERMEALLKEIKPDEKPDLDASDIIDGIDKKQRKDNVEELCPKTIYWGSKRFLVRSYDEVNNYYLLTNRKVTFGRFQPNRANQVYKAVVEMENQIQFAGGPNILTTSMYFLQRAHFLKNAEKRKYMEMVIKQLKVLKLQLGDYLKKGKNNVAVYKRDFCLIGIVAVDREGKIICQTGNNGFLVNNCTFPLGSREIYQFGQNIFDDQYLPRLKGGAIYISALPPFNVLEIPWVIKCIESAVVSVCIGTIPDEHNQGLSILETGKCKFNRQNAMESFLEKYLKANKHYTAESAPNQITYNLGSPVTISFFDRDLLKNVSDVNSDFLHQKNPTAFI